MSNNYSLTIKLEEGTKKKVAEDVGGAGGINDKNAAPGGEVSQEDNKSTKSIIKKVFGYSAIKSFVTQGLNYNVSTVQLRTGSHEAQQRANFTYSMALQGLGVVETIAGGGLVAGTGGAAIGLIAGIYGAQIQWLEKQNTVNMQNHLETYQQNLAAQRATYSGSRYQTVLQE